MIEESLWGFSAALFAAALLLVRPHSAREQPLSVIQGLLDASSGWVVSHRWDDWKSEVVWMSLSSAAVWLSIGLIHAPTLRNAERRRADGPQQAPTLAT